MNWIPEMGPPETFQPKVREQSEIGFWNISSRLTSAASFIEIGWPDFQPLEHFLRQWHLKGLFNKLSSILTEKKADILSFLLKDMRTGKVFTRKSIHLLPVWQPSGLYWSEHLWKIPAYAALPPRIMDRFWKRFFYWVCSRAVSLTDSLFLFLANCRLILAHYIFVI